MWNYNDYDNLLPVAFFIFSTRSLCPVLWTLDLLSLFSPSHTTTKHKTPTMWNKWTNELCVSFQHGLASSSPNLCLSDLLPIANTCSAVSLLILVNSIITQLLLHQCVCVWLVVNLQTVENESRTQKYHWIFGSYFAMV